VSIWSYEENGRRLYGHTFVEAGRRLYGHFYETLRRLYGNLREGWVASIWPLL
jgi:hypothetical protein